MHYLPSPLAMLKVKYFIIMYIAPSTGIIGVNTQSWF